MFRRLVGVGFLLFTSGCTTSQISTEVQKPVITQAFIGPKEHLVEIEQIFDEVNVRTSASKAFFYNFYSFFESGWMEGCRARPRPACFFQYNRVILVQEECTAVIFILIPPDRLRMVSYANIVEETPTIAARRTAEEAISRLRQVE